MRTLAAWLCVVFAVVLFVTFAPFDVSVNALLGWLLFTLRVIPRMEVDEATVGLGCVALLLFALCVHWLGRFGKRSTSAHLDGAAGRWKIRWTMSIVVGLLLLFTAGIAMIGIVHQAGWMLTEKEPLYVKSLEKYDSYSDNNLETAAYASLDYCADNQQTLPAGGTFGPDGEMLHSWETRILPYVPYSTHKIDMSRPWNDPVNERYFKCIIPVFINHPAGQGAFFDENGFGLSHYAANVHVMGPNSAVKLRDLDDGPRILIGEVNENFKPWGHPVNWRDPTIGINRGPTSFGGSFGSGGAKFAMSDGSVRFVSDNVDPAVLRSISMPMRRRRVGNDDF